MGETDRAWLTPDYPQLRAGAPWVMEEMILAQPGLVEPVLGADGPELTALRSDVVEAARAGAPVVVTGCGTSEHAALAVADLLTDSFRVAGVAGRAEARQALDAALDPRSGGVCLAISHDGATRATRLALDAARDAGAATAIVTACGDADCVASADRAFVTPVHDDSWCHTLAYTSAILAGANIAGRSSGAGTAARSWRDAAESPPGAGTLGGARAAIETTLARRGDLEAAAVHLGGAGRIVTAGLGFDLVSASELALKIAEGARIATTVYHLETLLHGHLAGCDPATTRLLLLGLDARPGPRRDRRLVLAAQAARAVGLATVAIAPAAVLAALPESVHRVVLDPVAASDPLLASMLQGTVAIQLLTLGLVGLTGTNPDLIRREEAPWREAARVGDATPDW